MKQPYNSAGSSRKTRPATSSATGFYGRSNINRDRERSPVNRITRQNRGKGAPNVSLIAGIITAAVLVIGLGIWLLATVVHKDAPESAVAAAPAVTRGPKETDSPAHTVEPFAPAAEQQTPTKPAETEAPAPSLPAVGDVVRMGHYEQDGSYADGAEEIEWIVLDVQGRSALLVSRYALDRKFYTQDEGAMTWEKSYLRTWLNGSFLSSAFDEAERQRILETYVPASRNPKHEEINPGASTYDNVFLLSYEEVMQYFSGASGRKCGATQYLKDQGAYIKEGGCWYWLRTPGQSDDYVMGISTIGEVHHDGIEATDTGSVRPAVWVSYS